MHRRRVTVMRAGLSALVLTLVFAAMSYFVLAVIALIVGLPLLLAGFYFIANSDDRDGGASGDNNSDSALSYGGGT